MSIAITLLGHAPKKKDGYSSGGGEGGTSQSKFLHLAWANSEEGEGFTKDNLDTDGHIKFFPYLGMCLSEDRDDGVLSFNSYQWTLLKSSKNSGSSGNGGSGGSGGSSGDGEDGTCKCDTCCNYKYCGEDESSDENPPKILWYRPTYQVQECHENSHLYGETETGIEFFGNQTTVMYADDEWNRLYSANPNGTHFIFNLPDLETCPQSFNITVVKYMDFNRGPMYFADFTDNRGKISLDLPLLTTLDGVQDDSEEARKIVVDKSEEKDGWIVRTNFEIVAGHIHRSCPIDTENPPVMYNDANDVTCVATISNSTWGNSTYKNALASFNDFSTAMFGEQKTEQIFAVRGQMKETFPRGMRPARDCVEDIHDYDVRYRWFATSREDLISLLPTHFTMKYHDISIEYPIELREYDGTGETTFAGGPLTGRTQYVADTNGYYGAVYDVTSCAYKDFKSDNFWLRFVHEYTIEQLCSGATKPLPSQGGTSDTPGEGGQGGDGQGGDVPSIDGIDPDDEDYSQYLSCSVGACDKGDITVSWPAHNVSSTWFQHGFYKDAKLWAYGTYFKQGAKFVDQLLGTVGLTINLTKDPLTGGTDGVYLARIDDGWYVTGPFPYNDKNYYVGIITDDSNTDGHESFKPGVWSENKS